MTSIHKQLTLTLVILAGAFLSQATPALAGGVHVFTNSFGSATSLVKDPEPLSEPTGIAIDEKTGEVYVIDMGHNRIERFNTKGTYEGQFNGSETPAKEFSNLEAVAVDNDPTSPSYGDIYVSDAGHNVIDKFEPDGKYLNQLAGTPAGPFQGELSVAVDPTGNLWVYEVSGPYGGEGGYYLEFNDATDNGFVVQHEVVGARSRNIAADSMGNLYVAGKLSGNIYGYSPGTERFNYFEGFLFAGATGVGVDQLTNNVYVDQGTSVAVFPPNPTGATPEETFATGHLTGGTVMAVSTTGTAYVADTSADDVAVFEEAPKPETPVTDETVVVEGLAATVKGELLGGEEDYYFAYNTNGTCAGTGTLETPVTAATGVTPVSVKITGLVAKTKYTFCLVAKNQFGSTSGAAEGFETKPSAPVIEEAAANVTEADVTLHASINPELEPSLCIFQYGKRESYEHEAPCQALGEGSKGVAVSAAVTGLEPDISYYYRVLAGNKTGGAQATGTFTTEVITPTPVETAQATNVTATSAVIGGQVNPQGAATYYVEYGPPACSLNGHPGYAWWLCATKSSEAGPLTGNSLQTVTPIQITGLTPGTTYKYWIVAYNKNGSERGEELKFTTPGVTTVTLPPVATVPTIIPSTILSLPVLPTPTISITSASVKGNTVVVSVRTSVSGTVTIAGTGLSKTTKTLTAGTHQLITPLSKTGKKDAKRHKKITLRVALAAGGESASASRAVKL